MTASEDCTVKVWDVNKFCNIKDVEGVLNFEPYLTLRGHLSPIMSSCATTESENVIGADNLLITGSRNGVIKMWNIPPID